MTIRQVSLALPTDQLADLGLHYEGDEAANLLAAATVLWHPALLAGSGKIPATVAVDTLLEHTELDNQLVLVPDLLWADDIDTWLQGFDAPLRQRVPPIRGVVERDAMWQTIAAAVDGLPGVDIDPSVACEFYALGFAYLQVDMLTRVMRYEPIGEETPLSSRAVAAAKKAVAGESFETELADAYDQLTQSRNHYYPTDYYLIDLTLTAPEVVGSELEKSCRETDATNLLMTGKLAEQIAGQHTSVADAIKQACQDARLEVIGGSYAGGDLARHEPEALLADVHRAEESFQALGAELGVFANFEGVVAPLVPQLASQLGLNGIFAVRLDGGRMPPLFPPRCRWQGLDGTAVEALVPTPYDRSDAGTMLRLSEHLAHAMDSDLVATLVLAGWPTAASPWYDDLRRVARRSEVLGRFVLLSEVFETTTASDHTESLEAHYFRSPSIPGQGESSVNVDGLASLASGSLVAPEQATWARLVGSELATPDEAVGWCHFNLSSAPAGTCEGKYSMQSVPSFGFAYCPKSPAPPPLPLADEHLLRNEKLELDVHEQTGSVASLRLHQQRGTQLSQKLVFTGIAEAAIQLAFDGFDNPLSDSAHGQLSSRHRIVDASGASLAKFTQTLRVSRAIPELTMEWHIARTEIEWPAHAGLSSRIAFRDHAASLRRSCQGVWLPWGGRRIKSKSVRIDSAPVPISVSGREWLDHIRVADNQLDSFLPIPPASQEATITIAYKIDEIASPPGDALGLAIPLKQAPAQTQGWWLHLSRPGIALTDLQVVPESSPLAFRARFLETAGKRGRCRVQAWCAIAAAQRTDFTGQNAERVEIVGGAAMLEFAPYEWTQVEFTPEFPGAC